MNSWASCGIAPHEAIGGRTPNPRKLNPATTMMLTPIRIVVTTSSDAIAFGRT